MLDSKVSIIIPVYNSEDYLEKCIKSVLMQTYNNWELILIDDGSTDSSWEIITRYSKDDSRIVGIKQQNKGPGLARNTGILKSSGEYIVFVDSDDYIDADYFSLLMEHAKDNDLIFIDVVRVNGNGKRLQDEKMSKYKSWSKEQIIRAMMTGKIPWGGVRKVVRRNVILEHGILYSDLRIGEEALFSFRSLLYANKVSFIDEKPVYMYVQRENSQSNYNIDDPWGGTFQVIKEYLESIDLYEKYANTINSLNATSTIISIDRMTFMYKNRDERKAKIRNRIDRFQKEYDKKYGIDVMSLTKKALVFYPFLRMSISFPIVIASKVRRSIRGDK